MNETRTSLEVPINTVFPLPYRIFFLAGLGALGWAVNMHGLDKFGIDVPSILDLTFDGSNSRPLPISHRMFASQNSASLFYKPVYRLALAYSGCCYLSWVLFRVFSQGEPARVETYKFIPGITSLSIFLAFVFPFKSLKAERDMFLGSILRCVFVSRKSTIYFVDVVFADIGTSFAKVFADSWLCIWMLLPEYSILYTPRFEGSMRWVAPMIMSVPFFVRFRQCLIEYQHPKNTSSRPFLNALKYATSFPVILLSAAQRESSRDMPWQKFLFRLWLLSAVVNSIYSFWWDVTNDWGLSLLKIDNEERSPRYTMLRQPHSGSPVVVNERELSHPNEAPDYSLTSQPTHDQHGMHQHSSHPFGLRSRLLYPLPVYPVLVFLNLMLRLTWSVKLSSHLHNIRDGSFAFFWLEVAEMIRRWLWVFLRVEWEEVKRTENVFNLRPYDVNRAPESYEVGLATPLVDISIS